MAAVQKYLNQNIFVCIFQVQTFVPKTFKQLSIFHIVFQDVLQNWPRGSSGKRKIVNKVKAIANKVGELKQKVRIPAVSDL